MSRALIYDIMLLFSCGVMTLGIIGILRLPDIYTKLHGASKSVFLGVLLLCLASTVVATDAMRFRVIIIAFMVVTTTPIASHVIGRAAYVMQEKMESPGAIDESHHLDDVAGDETEATWRI